MPNAKLDDMMRKIKALIARAEHPNTPEGEADSARAMADKLMRKYRIEESTLIEQGAMDAEKITPGEMTVDVCPWSSEFYQTYWNIMNYVAQHVGARMAQASGFVDGVHYLRAVLVGYESDLRFADVLFTNAKITFRDRMEPKPDPSLSDEDNVYRMRKAGMERIRVAYLMGWTKGGAKVTRLYKEACAKRGEEPLLTGQGNSVKVYREAYADGFCAELWQRLYHARNAADQEGGGGLVLANRKDNVDEAFYQRFPNLRPTAAKAIGENTNRKRARQYKETAAARKRWERQASAMGQAGRSSGRKAASEIKVDGVKPAKRLGD